MKLLGWVAALVIIVLAYMFGRSVVHETQLRAEADSLRAERILAGEEAERARSAADSMRELALIAETTLAGERARADSAIAALDREADSLAVAARASGEDVRRAVFDALAGSGAGSPDSGRDVVAVLDRHLAEDARLEASLRSSIAERDEVIVAADSLVLVLRGRIETTERALAATEVECRLCREEADRWRAIAEPGLLARIRRGIPWLGGGAAAGALLILIL